MNEFDGTAATFRNAKRMDGKRAGISCASVQARNAQDIPETGRTLARKPVAGGRASCLLTANKVLPK